MLKEQAAAVRSEAHRLLSESMKVADEQQLTTPQWDDVSEEAEAEASWLAWYREQKEKVELARKEAELDERATAEASAKRRWREAQEQAERDAERRLVAAKARVEELKRIERREREIKEETEQRKLQRASEARKERRRSLSLVKTVALLGKGMSPMSSPDAKRAP